MIWKTVHAYKKKRKGRDKGGISIGIKKKIANEKGELSVETRKSEVTIKLQINKKH